MRVLGLLCLVFCFGASASAQQPRGQVTFIVPHANTCAKILALQSVQTSFKTTPENIAKVQEYKSFAGWLEGYISAANSYHPKSPGDFSNGLTTKDMVNWFFSYCRENPRATFLQAYKAFNASLRITE